MASSTHTGIASASAKEMASGITITKRKVGSAKSPVYTGADLNQLLNEKYNWLCANTHEVFARQNGYLYGLLKMLATRPKNLINGYEAMLLLQITTPREEGILMMILRDIKKRTSDPSYVLGYRFEFERDGEEERDEEGHPIPTKYEDYMVQREFDGYSLMMMAAHKNLWKIAKFLYLEDAVDSPSHEVYQEKSGVYKNLYTYALSQNQIGFLTILFQKSSSTFWDRIRTTPEELVENLKSRTATLDHTKNPAHKELLSQIFALMEMIVVEHPDHFVDNQLYLDFARNHQNEALLAMLRHGEINPMYTDRVTGNTAFIYAAKTRNLELFEMLLYSMPLSHLVQKNAEGKAAIDYLPASSRTPKVQQMGAMLRSYLKFLLERPKLVIMNGKDTIYLNPNPPALEDAPVLENGPGEEA